MVESFTSVDEYIAAQPAAAQRALRRVRAAIREAIPQAQEIIAYNIPGYKLEGASVVESAGVEAPLRPLPLRPLRLSKPSETNFATLRSVRVRSVFHMEIPYRRA